MVDEDTLIEDNEDRMRINRRTVDLQKDCGKNENETRAVVTFSCKEVIR